MKLQFIIRKIAIYGRPGLYFYTREMKYDVQKNQRASGGSWFDADIYGTLSECKSAHLLAIWKRGTERSSWTIMPDCWLLQGKCGLSAWTYWCKASLPCIPALQENVRLRAAETASRLASCKTQRDIFFQRRCLFMFICFLFFFFCQEAGWIPPTAQYRRRCKNPKG